MNDAVNSLEEVVRLIEAGRDEQALGLLEDTGFALLEATLCETTWSRRGRSRARGADFAYWVLARLPNRQKVRVTPELLAWTIPLRCFPRARPFAVRSQLRATR